MNVWVILKQHQCKQTTQMSIKKWLSSSKSTLTHICKWKRDEKWQIVVEFGEKSHDKVLIVYDIKVLLESDHIWEIVDKIWLTWSVALRDDTHWWAGVNVYNK